MDNAIVILQPGQPGLEQLRALGFETKHEYKLYLQIMKSIQKPVIPNIAS